MAKPKNKNTLGKIVLEPEEREHLIREIQYYFSTERDEELGSIAADMILDFFVENLGALAYNQGLNDAKRWFGKKLEDLNFDYDLLYKIQSK